MLDTYAHDDWLTPSNASMTHPALEVVRRLKPHRLHAPAACGSLGHVGFVRDPSSWAETRQLKLVVNITRGASPSQPSIMRTSASSSG